MEIIVNKQKISLRFSYSLIRALAKKWQLKNVETVVNKIMTVFAAAEEDVFSAIDTVTEIVIEAAKLTESSVNENDVADLLFADPQVMLNVITEFVNSMPQVSADDVENLKKKVVIK